MNAVLPRDHEGEFFDSQMLPPQERGVTFEVLYFRQLQLVTNRIHETENIDQIMLDASQDICKLFNADRLTLYAVWMATPYMACCRSSTTGATSRLQS